MPALGNNSTAQVDMLYRVLEGRHYGHPNPKRCEWVLNGGNPGTGVDLLEEPQYPVGTLPDRNWHPPAFDYGEHFSPNGTANGYLYLAEYAGMKITLLRPR